MEEEYMNMSENERFILGLRSAGWNEKQINDFMLYIASGNTEYLPEKTNDHNTFPNSEGAGQNLLREALISLENGDPVRAAEILRSCLA